jgi:cell shape-determining protein MreC
MKIELSETEKQALRETIAKQLNQTPSPILTAILNKLNSNWWEE